MTVSYQATLEDLTEAATRSFLRTRTFRVDRLKSTIVNAAFLGAIFIALTWQENLEMRCWGIAFGFGFGGVIPFVAHPELVRSRLRKYLRRELGASLPIVTYSIHEGRLIHESRGVIISFALADLTAVSENKGILELDFGNKGITILPLRAFKTATERSEFMAALDNRVNQQTSLDDSPTRVYHSPS